MFRSVFASATAMLLAQSFACAQPEGFSTGPLIEAYGPVATIETREPIPEGTVFQISFDVVDKAGEGELNRSFVSAARFLNMHAAAGIAPEDMKLAIVIHGSAVDDVTNAAWRIARDATPNQQADLISTLLAHGVEIHVCGQSAAYRGIATEDLLPGVKMSLSAMTSHALLQQAGYTLNPF